MSKLQKPTPRAIKHIRKKYKLDDNQSLSLKQYREALELSSSATKRDSKGRVFNISYKLISYSYDEVIIECSGDLISRNVFGALSLKDRIRYSNAHKEARHTFMLQHRDILKKYEAMQKAEISFVIGARKKGLRDWDGNSESIKKVQDSIVKFGFLTDDNPNVLSLAQNGIMQRVIDNRNKPFIMATVKRIININKEIKR